MFNEKVAKINAQKDRGIITHGERLMSLARLMTEVDAALEDGQPCPSCSAGQPDHTLNCLFVALHEEVR
jgi:hypothetical protein